MRASTILATSLVVQCICWVIVDGLDAYMNITVPQYLFGIQISHDLSMSLCLLVLAGIPLSGLVAIASFVIVVRRRLGRPVAW